MTKVRYIPIYTNSNFEASVDIAPATKASHSATADTTAISSEATRAPTPIIIIAANNPSKSIVTANDVA